LPETIEERISTYRAQNMADGVMYRRVLAEAAPARDWLVPWYDAAAALRRKSIEDVLEMTGAGLGSPWQKDHRMAMAAAIAAAVKGGSSRSSAS
jgi:hypothetical protein